MIDLIEETNENGLKYDSQVQIDGVWFHKASVLKQTFQGKKVSKDRLRRVQGLSSTLGKKEDMNLDNLVMKGDAILFLGPKNQPVLGTIKKITKGGKALHTIQGGQLQEENISLEIKEIIFDTDDSHYIWKGSSEEVKKISGLKCRSIQPEIQFEDNKVSYHFNKSLIFDIGISMANDTSAKKKEITSLKTGSSGDKKCFLCPKHINIEDIKVHVGKHILDGSAEGPQPCGYCGRGNTCQNKLGKPNKKRGALFYNKVESNCPFYMHTARRVQKPSKKYPCTNYLLKCSICKADIWYYNMPHHYQTMHPNHEVPQIEEAEKDLMNKSKL